MRLDDIETVVHCFNLPHFVIRLERDVVGFCLKILNYFFTTVIITHKTAGFSTE